MPKIKHPVSLQPQHSPSQTPVLGNAAGTARVALPHCTRDKIRSFPSKSINASIWIRGSVPAKARLVHTTAQAPLTSVLLSLGLLCLLASALHLPGTAHAGVTSTQGSAFIGKPTAYSHKGTESAWSAGSSPPRLASSSKPVSHRSVFGQMGRSEMLSGKNDTTFD